MKRILIAVAAVTCVIVAAMLSNARPDKTADAVAPQAKFEIASEAKNPFTGLVPNANPDQFQFAVVSDRTGGHRKGIFSRAVHQINLMQPEFVMSVGDLIEGQATAELNRKMWDELDGYVRKLEMPFFYAPGNHDAQSLIKANVWTERLGRRYYHFNYKNCLFLVLNAYDEADDDATKDASYKKTRIGKAQRAYIEQTLKENAGARWTFVFVHPPIWAEKDITTTGWLEVEKSLNGRKYTVFAGHLHTYRMYIRNGMNYYQLATTGGGSSLRGVEYGEFDQIAWLTMKPDGPVLANILLDGVQNDTLTPYESDENGKDNEKVAGLFPVSGTATLAGEPAAGLTVIFTEIPKPRAIDEPVPKVAPVVAVADGRIGQDGTFAISARRGSSGLKPGRYAVTFIVTPSLVIDGKPKPANPVPEKYRSLSKTPFHVEVKPGENRFEFAMEE